jgi:hypothetical protein
MLLTKSRQFRNQREGLNGLESFMTIMSDMKARRQDQKFHTENGDLSAGDSVRGNEI